jgi:rhodanese-related sulfurtransferase
MPIKITRRKKQFHSHSGNGTGHGNSNNNKKNKNEKDNKQDILPFLCEYVKSTKTDWNYITPMDFYHKFYKPGKMDEIFLIDLRKKEEYEKFHIPGSHNIFWLDLLQDKELKNIPKNKTIYLICYVGHTSSQAMVLLKLLGYKVVSIKFGYGKSPAFEIPVAGWLNYNYPVSKN